MGPGATAASSWSKRLVEALVQFRVGRRGGDDRSAGSPLPHREGHHQDDRGRSPPGAELEGPAAGQPAHQAGGAQASQGRTGGGEEAGQQGHPDRRRQPGRVSSEGVGDEERKERRGRVQQGAQAHRRGGPHQGGEGGQAQQLGDDQPLPGEREGPVAREDHPDRHDQAQADAGGGDEPAPPARAVRGPRQADHGQEGGRQRGAQGGQGAEEEGKGSPAPLQGDQGRQPECLTAEEGELADGHREHGRHGEIPGSEGPAAQVEGDDPVEGPGGEDRRRDRGRGDADQGADGREQDAVAEGEVAAVPAAVPQHQAVGSELHDPVELGGLIDAAPAQQATMVARTRVSNAGARHRPVHATRCDPTRGEWGSDR